jgi:hypothetical protein
MAECRVPRAIVVTISRKSLSASHAALDASGPYIECHCIIVPASPLFDVFEDREGVSIVDVASDADLRGVKGYCCPSLVSFDIA